MRIRSLTLFCQPDFPPDRIQRLLASARDAFAFPLQSARLATPPFPAWWPTDPAPGPVAEHARALAGRWQAAGADYISLGPVQLHHDAAWLAAVPPLIAATEVLFASVEIADLDGTIDVDRCRDLAGTILAVSRLKEHGFGNLYLAALAHCPPGSPYFPVAYHRGGGPRLAIAVEAADLAFQAVHEARSLEDARWRLVQAIEGAAASISETAASLAAAHDIGFNGIDFSLAPFPDPDKSLAGALEGLGPDHVGAPGSLFAAAFLADVLARADFRRCGFSGVMLPVLEDSVLARRAAAGQLTISDLLSYAAVCGVGLDTLPLPGDVSQASLTGILLDVAALAARLHKPLTARLMPVPGRQAGDPIAFDFPYFADGAVMHVAGAGLPGAAAGGGRLRIWPLHRPFAG